MGLLLVSTYRLRHLAFSLGRAMGLLQVFPRPSILKPETETLNVKYGGRIRLAVAVRCGRGAGARRLPVAVLGCRKMPWTHVFCLLVGRCLGRTCFVFSFCVFVPCVSAWACDVWMRRHDKARKPKDSEMPACRVRVRGLASGRKHRIVR